MNYKISQNNNNNINANKNQSKNKDLIKNNSFFAHCIN